MNGVYGDVRNKVNHGGDCVELNQRRIALVGYCSTSDAHVWEREESIAADDVLENVIASAFCMTVSDLCPAHVCIYDQEICRCSCGIGDNRHQEGSCKRIAVDSCERIAVDSCKRIAEDFCEKTVEGSCYMIAVGFCVKTV